MATTWVMAPAEYGASGPKAGIYRRCWEYDFENGVISIGWDLGEAPVSREHLEVLWMRYADPAWADPAWGGPGAADVGVFLVRHSGWRYSNRPGRGFEVHCNRRVRGGGLLRPERRGFGLGLFLSEGHVGKRSPREIGAFRVGPKHSLSVGLGAGCPVWCLIP